MSNFRKRWVLSAGMFCAFFLAGCAKANVLPDDGPLRTEVEKLYGNYHELRVVHSDLHEAARRHMVASGEELAEIQSAARFIGQANLIAYYQWELLSISAYIRDRARADFFTLRARSIADARRNSTDLILAIKVYEAFIHDPEALSLIEKGIGYIEHNLTLYDALLELVTPLGNPVDPAPAAGRPALLLRQGPGVVGGGAFRLDGPAGLV